MSKKTTPQKESEPLYGIVKSITRKIDKEGNEVGEVNIVPIEISKSMINKIPVGKVVIKIEKMQPPMFGEDVLDEDED